MPTYEGTASPEAVAEEIRALGGSAVADRIIASEQGAAALIRAALDTFGSVDILVNNAALCILAPFDVMTSAHYQRIVETNLMGPVWTSRAAWPHMKAKGYGRIVNIGAAVFGGTRLMSAYGVSKGGLFLLSQSLAVEGHAHGIKAKRSIRSASRAWCRRCRTNPPCCSSSCCRIFPRGDSSARSLSCA